MDRQCRQEVENGKSRAYAENIKQLSQERMLHSKFETAKEARGAELAMFNSFPTRLSRKNIEVFKTNHISRF